MRWLKAGLWFLTEWVLSLPRLLLASILAQLGLMGALMAYAKLRNRSVENSFPQLDLPPIDLGEHSVQLFDDGGSVFRQMLFDISLAKESILLESYIFERDEVGLAFKRALIRKAREGVKIYVTFDGIGTLHVPERFKLFGKRRNIRVFEFGRLKSIRSFFDTNMWIRTHRKILVIDGKIGYLGGMNIGRNYARTWRDTHLKIEGPIAANIAEEFIALWNKYNKKHKINLSYATTSDQQVGICANDPIEYQLPIRQTYLDAINDAKHYIYISNAYFLPDPLIRATLIDAAKRGVDIQIMVPEISDNIVVDWICRGLLGELMEHGARVLLYRGTMIHAKTMTVDGLWSTVGSANLDTRSLAANYEINATIKHPAFARQMEAMFLNDRAQSREINYQTWRSRSIFIHIGEQVLQPARGLF